MDLTVLGKTPVTEDQPAGSDVRYDPLFDALQAEIDKQSNPSASGGTDWKAVEKLAVEILSTKSKDILVASYLAVAQLQLRKEAGVAPGLHLYRDLLENYWDNLFPPKKRKRGRVAAIEWWLEKAEPALQDLQPSPLPPEDIDTYRQDINRIAEVLRENLDTPLSLRVMERYIDSIPVASDAEPEPEKPSEASAPEPKPAPRSAPPPPAETGAGEIKSGTDAEKTARAGFVAVRRAADFIESQNLADSRSYRWRRIAGWGMIQMPPPSTDGQTQVPAPTQFESAMNELNSLKAAQNWEALVRASEEKFQGTVLWLDLNRFAAEALTALGGNHLEAADAVSLETALLVHRLPGLESLTFADGSPFADMETREWLGQIRFQESGETVERASNPGGGDAMSEVLEKARGLAGKKKMREAFALLHQELRRCDSGQDGFRWRVHLCAMLLDAKKPQLALPHLEAILQDVDSHGLEKWDPKLAMQGLKVAWRGFKTVSDPAAQTGDVYKRIAKLDLSEALQLA